MSKKLDINENDLIVLSLFTEGYSGEYYIREISSRLPISHGTAQTVLERLEKKFVLSSALRGKTRIFRIKPGETAVQYFLLVEQYKKISFMEEKPYVTEILNKISPFINGVMLLFGSYSKGTDTKDSDIDILITGNYDERKISGIGKMYKTAINIKAFQDSVFTSNDRHDTLLTEVKKHHIVWKNGEPFVSSVIA